MPKMTPKFTWTDLSTFDVDQTKRFYRDCFGWTYHNDGGYFIASSGRYPSAGIYEMPAQFQAINMPSFWMPYIRVADIAATVSRARDLGAIIEIASDSLGDSGEIALIRDPLGAGFTVYAGDELGGVDQAGRAGRMVWAELHISDINKASGFYQELFGWEIKRQGSADRYDIVADGAVIGAVEEMDNATKGDKEYWSIFFAVDDMERTIQTIEGNGGTTQRGASATLVYDPQGAFFFITQTDGSDSKTNGFDFKWRTWLGLLLVAVAVLANWDWVWGVLFLVWLIPDLRSGSTFFLEPLHKSQNPMAYWAVMGTWLILSVYMLLGLFF